MAQLPNLVILAFVFHCISLLNYATEASADSLPSNSIVLGKWAHDKAWCNNQDGDQVPISITMYQMHGFENSCKFEKIYGSDAGPFKVISKCTGEGRSYKSSELYEVSGNILSVTQLDGVPRKVSFVRCIDLKNSTTPKEVNVQPPRPTDKQQDTPTFASFPAEIFNGPARPPRIDTAEAHMFRTMVRQAAYNRVGFAGSFGVNIYGCGTGCIQIVTVDRKTGKVVFVPGPQTDQGKVGPEAQVEYRADSRVLVTYGTVDDKGPLGARYWLMEDGHFRLLKTVPMAEANVSEAKADTVPVQSKYPPYRQSGVARCTCPGTDVEFFLDGEGGARLVRATSNYEGFTNAAKVKNWTAMETRKGDLTLLVLDNGQQSRIMTDPRSGKGMGFLASGGVSDMLCQVLVKPK